MSICLRYVLVTYIIMAACAFSVAAQTPVYIAPPAPEEAGNASTDVGPAPQSVSNTYTLEKGDNEFGFWAGGSFKATTIFEGLSDAEARDRKFFIAAFRYGRTLVANDSLAFQYTVDAVPLAVATGNITNTTVGPVTSFQRDTAYGAGLTPIGFQLDFANGSRVHPFVHVNGGFLVFNNPVPLPDAGRFAFVGETGGGVRIFTSERRAVTLGLRFHHLSNGDRSGSNRGLNNFVIYGGFSIFK